MDDLYLRGLRLSWEEISKESYVHKIPALREVSQLSFQAPITFLVGENGSGKSTLLEAIAVKFGYNAEGGTRNYRFQTFDDLSALQEGLTLVKGWQRPKYGYFFRAETFFNVATVSLSEYMGDNYHANSHGEGNLRFLLFDKPGLYLMDEPEAALSPQRQLGLLKHIYEMARLGSQFIIATHSPVLLGCPEAQILSLQEDGIRPCAYEETESYQITRSFLLNKDSLLRHLLWE